MLSQKLLGATAAPAPAGNIQYVGGHVEGFAGTTSNVTIFIDDLLGGLASAPAAGDLVIVYFGTGSTVDRNLVVSGYDEVVELYSNDSEDTNLVVAYKFMGGTPDVSFTLTGGTLSTADAGAVAVQVWRGVSEFIPFDVNRTTWTGTNGIFCDPPAITPVTPGSVIVAGGAGAHNDSTLRTFSSSDLTGFISSGRGGSNAVAIGLGYHVWTSGSFNPAQFTFSGANSLAFSWAAVTLALRPA